MGEMMNEGQNLGNDIDLSQFYSIFFAVVVIHCHDLAFRFVVRQRGRFGFLQFNAPTFKSIFVLFAL